MKPRQSWLRLAGLALTALYLVGHTTTWICGEIDYRKALRGEKPPFARWSGFLADGGTQIYQGFGYTVLRIHSFHNDEEPATFPPRTRYMIGAQLQCGLHGLFPVGRPDHGQAWTSDVPDRKDA